MPFNKAYAISKIIFADQHMHLHKRPQSRRKLYHSVHLELEGIKGYRLLDENIEDTKHTKTIVRCNIIFLIVTYLLL